MCILLYYWWWSAKLRFVFWNVITWDKLSYRYRWPLQWPSRSIGRPVIRQKCWNPGGGWGWLCSVVVVDTERRRNNTRRHLTVQCSTWTSLAKKITSRNLRYNSEGKPKLPLAVCARSVTMWLQNCPEMLSNRSFQYSMLLEFEAAPRRRRRIRRKRRKRKIRRS